LIARRYELVSENPEPLLVSDSDDEVLRAASPELIRAQRLGS
jgi:hypothetical protein